MNSEFIEAPVATAPRQAGVGCSSAAASVRKHEIIFSAPGLNPSIEEAARAFWDAGLLSHLCTTVAFPGNGALLRAVGHLDTVLKTDMASQLKRRKIAALPAGAITTFPLWELTRSTLSRLRVDGRICDLVFDLGIRSFDRAVARRLPGSGAAYCYEYSAHETFRVARRRGLLCVYEVPSLEHDFVERLIDNELDALAVGSDRTRGYLRERQAARTRRRHEEWAMADVIVLHSKVARESYRNAGIPVDKVRVLPLGCPAPGPEAAAGGGAPGQALRIMWAGNFSILKGAQYFLRALRGFEARGAIDVHVFGQVSMPERLMADLPDCMTLHGTVDREALKRQYARADVLMFPTLCDGFGMVLTEALAQGLPVITTRRAGAADFIQHQENGLIVPPGDASALTGAIHWCLDNRDRLKAMRATARDTAASWQWADYRAALAEEVMRALAGR